MIRVLFVCHTGTCLHAYKSRLCGDLAAVRFRKPAVICTRSCSLRGILKENKTSGLHALDPDGIHDGSYLHSTWHDHHKAFKGTGNNRAGSWKHLTACICSITADPWCTGSDSGCEEVA